MQKDLAPMACEVGPDGSKQDCYRGAANTRTAVESGALGMILSLMGQLSRGALRSFAEGASAGGFRPQGLFLC